MLVSASFARTSHSRRISANSGEQLETELRIFVGSAGDENEEKEEEEEDEQTA